MKKFKFLFKPVFYIFSLLFATWLVIKIENIKPSDLEDKEFHLHEQEKFLQNLCSEYKKGIIDSVEFNKKLIFFLESNTGSSFK